MQQKRHRTGADNCQQDGLGEHWKRTTDLYLGEFDKAQTGQNRRIDLNVEF